MARDPRRTIAALERKAADRATTGPEAEALRAKADELRAKLPAPPQSDAERIRELLRLRDRIERDAATPDDIIRIFSEGMASADRVPGSPGWRRGTGF